MNNNMEGALSLKYFPQPTELTPSNHLRVAEYPDGSKRVQQMFYPASGGQSKWLDLPLTKVDMEGREIQNGSGL